MHYEESKNNSDTVVCEHVPMQLWAKYLKHSDPNKLMFSFSNSFRVDGETVQVCQQKLFFSMHEALVYSNVASGWTY